MRTSAFRVRYAQRGNSTPDKRGAMRYVVVIHEHCSQSTKTAWCSAVGFSLGRWGLGKSTNRFPAFSAYCTFMLTVAVLLARLGSGVSAMVAPLSVITVPAGVVTFTVNRTVQVVFGAMLLFS